MRRLLIVLCLSCLPGSLRAASDDAGWTQLKQDDGITVWERPVPGTSNIEFRGRGLIDAPVLSLTAVAFASSRSTEWMYHCTEAYVLETKSPDHLVAYNRVASGVFIVSDRDMVLDVKLAFIPAEKTVRVVVKNIDYPGKPSPSGVVRVAKIDGFWQFEAKEHGKTEVTYQILSDPAGMLPSWLVHQQARDLPLLTIKGLRNQVRKPGYEAYIAKLRGAFDWSPYE